MKCGFAPVALLMMATAHGAGAQTRPKAAATVDSVVVTGERPQTQVLIDRTVYSVSADLQAVAGSAADVLNKLPSVTVDADGAISLRGDSNVTVLVDGRPSAQFAGPARGQSLLQFPANEIDRIEVLTNPPAQYKAEGSGGVINIITKKTGRAGLTGTAQASVGEYGRYVLGLGGAYNSGPLKLSGGIGLRHDVKARLTTSDRTEVDPASGLPTESRQSIDEHFHRLTPSVKGGIDYQLDDRQTVGASFNYRALSGHRYFDQHDESAPPGLAAGSISDRHSEGREWNADSAQAVHFEQKLWRPDETLSLAVNRSGDREREHYQYRNVFTLPATAPTFDDLNLSHDLLKTEFSADYDLPMAHGRELKLGAALEDDRNLFDQLADLVDPAGQRTVNPAVTNHFRYRQRVSAAYADYQMSLGEWRVDAGLRVEATHVSWLQVTGQVSGGRNEAAAYPSLHIDRAIGDDDKLSAGVSRRVSRPDPEILNPFTDHQDIHTLRAGNADLRPQDTWSYEMGYSHNGARLGYRAAAYYRRDKDSVTDVVRPISADVVLVTKANLPLSHSTGLELSANGKLGRSLSYNLSGDIFHAQIDASALGIPGLRSTTGVNLKASLDYRPTAVDAAQVAITRTDKRLTPQGEIAAISQVNLGYRRQLSPSLAAVVTLSDALDGQKLQRLIDTAQLREVYLRHQIGRVAYVGFVYTFGGPAKAKSFEYDQ